MKKVSRRAAIQMAAGALAMAALGEGPDAPLERTDLALSAHGSSLVLTEDKLVGKDHFIMEWIIEVVYDDETGHISDANVREGHYVLRNA